MPQIRPTRVVLAVLLTLLGACATKSRFQPAELTSVDDVQVKIEKSWSRDIGTVGPSRALRPLVAAGRVFTADSKGRVQALADDGGVLWSVETDRRLGSGPALVDGQLIFGDRDGGVIALAAADGAERWHVAVSSEVITVPAGDASLLAVKSEDGRLHALNPQDGSTLWVAPLNVPALTWRGNAPLELTDEAILVGTSTGRLKAFARGDGALLWEDVIAEASGRSEVQRLVDVDAELLLAGPVIVAVSTGGNLKVLRAESGQLVWERAVGGFVGASLDEVCLYVVDKDDFVSCLDPRSGAAMWTQEGFKYRRLSGPLPWKGNVLVADFEGYAHVLSAANGEVIGRKKLSRGAINWLGVAPEGGVLSLAANGRLSMFDVQPRR